MSAPTQTRAPLERTEHPHIVKSADTLGGEPRVEGTRIPVLQLFEMAEHGVTPAEIVADFPDLSLAQVHDALSYAHDHPDEMAFYEEENQIRTVMRKNDLVLVGNRLISRHRLDEIDVPAGTPVYTWETLPEALES